MSNENSSSNSGNLLGLLGIVFIVLKLTNVIDWSWWYVTMPFWGALALILAGMIIYLIYKVVSIMLDNRKHDKMLDDALDDIKPQNLVKKSKFQQRLEEAAFNKMK